MFNRAVHFIFSLLAVVSLVSCGGGGGSAGSEGGIGGTGISSGRVTGFGSVIVNGVHFDTTGAVVTKDDGTAETNNNDANINTLLSEGMVVTIEGTINANGLTGTADKITYQDKLEGPVVGTPANGSFVALGQTVIVSSLTRYSGGLNAVTDISDRQVVEVSGFYDTNGKIIATFIEKKADNYVNSATVFEIKGIATVVDATTFNIGALTIVSTDTTGLNNKFVEVYGTFNGVDTLAANSVEIKTQGFNVGNKQSAELEGIATSGCTTVPCDFTLNDVTVRVSSSTQFKAGLVSDINAGVFVEAEGSLQGNILIADEIDFKDNIEIQGDVQSKGTDTVVVDFGASDLTVKVDTNLTRIKGCNSENFADITGNITIRARKTPTDVVATRVECGGTAGEVYIQAQVDSFAYDSLNLLGLVVDTSTATKFEDSNSNLISRTIFYNSVKDGNLVEVVGTVSGGSVNWAEVKLDL